MHRPSASTHGSRSSTRSDVGAFQPSIPFFVVARRRLETFVAADGPSTVVLVRSVRGMFIDVSPPSTRCGHS
jgi:hypothetical protein